MNKTMIQLSTSPCEVMFEHMFEGLRSSSFPDVRTQIEEQWKPSKVALPERVGIPLYGSPHVVPYSVDVSGKVILDKSVKDVDGKGVNDAHLMDQGDSFPYALYLKLLYLQQYFVGTSLLLRSKQAKLPSVKEKVNLGHHEARYPDKLTDVEESVYASVLTKVMCQYKLYNKITARRVIIFNTILIQTVKDMVASYAPRIKKYVNISVSRGGDPGSYDHDLPRVMSTTSQTVMRSLLNNHNEFMDIFMFSITGIDDFVLGADSEFVLLKTAFASIFNDKLCVMSYTGKTDNEWLLALRDFGKGESKYTSSRTSFAHKLIRMYSHVFKLSTGNIKQILNVDDNRELLGDILGAGMYESKLVLMGYDPDIPSGNTTATLSSRMSGVHTYITLDGEEKIGGGCSEEASTTFFHAFSAGNMNQVMVPFGEIDENSLALYAYIPMYDPILKKISVPSHITGVSKNDVAERIATRSGKVTLRHILPGVYDHLNNDTSDSSIIHLIGFGYLVKKNRDLFNDEILTPMSMYVKQAFVKSLGDIPNIGDISNPIRSKKVTPKVDVAEQIETQRIKYKSRLLPGLTIYDIKGGDFTKWKAKFPHSRLKTLEDLAHKLKIIESGAPSIDSDVEDYKNGGMPSLIGYFKWLVSLVSTNFESFFFNSGTDDHSGELIDQKVRINIGELVHIVNNNEIYTRQSNKEDDNVQVTEDQHLLGSYSDTLESIGTATLTAEEKRGKEAVEKKIDQLFESVIETDSKLDNIDGALKVLSNLIDQKVSLIRSWNETVIKSAVSETTIDANKELTESINELDAKIIKLGTLAKMFQESKYVNTGTTTTKFNRETSEAKEATEKTKGVTGKAKEVTEKKYIDEIKKKVDRSVALERRTSKARSNERIRIINQMEQTLTTNKKTVEDRGKAAMNELKSFQNDLAQAFTSNAARSTPQLRVDIAPKWTVFTEWKAKTKTELGKLVRSTQIHTDEISHLNTLFANIESQSKENGGNLYTKVITIVEDSPELKANVSASINTTLGNLLSSYKTSGKTLTLADKQILDNVLFRHYATPEYRALIIETVSGVKDKNATEQLKEAKENATKRADEAKKLAKEQEETRVKAEQAKKIAEEKEKKEKQEQLIEQQKKEKAEEERLKKEELAALAKSDAERLEELKKKENEKEELFKEAKATSLGDLTWEKYSQIHNMLDSKKKLELVELYKNNTPMFAQLKSFEKKQSGFDGWKYAYNNKHMLENKTLFSMNPEDFSTIMSQTMNTPIKEHLKSMVQTANENLSEEDQLKISASAQEFKDWRDKQNLQS